MVDVNISPPEVPDLSELARLCAKGEPVEVQDRLNADTSELNQAIGKDRIESYRDCLKAITKLGASEN